MNGLSGRRREDSERLTIEGLVGDTGFAQLDLLHTLGRRFRKFGHESQVARHGVARHGLAQRAEQFFDVGTAFDPGMVDDDDNFIFKDRITDSIRRRGESISSFSVEESVRALPGVLEVAAYAMRSEIAETEEEVMIAVVPRLARVVPQVPERVDGGLGLFQYPAKIAYGYRGRQTASPITPVGTC